METYITIAEILTDKVVLQRPVTTRTAAGQQVITFEDVATTWANLRPISNRKIREGAQDQVVDTYLITLRPRSDVQKGWRIVTKYLIFTVRSPDRSRRDRLVLTGEADIVDDRTSGKSRA